MNYLIQRLKEASTWLGIILVATAAGAHWSPESQETVITVILHPGESLIGTT